MKDITVGYFDLLEKTFISAVEINKNFLNLLKHYVNVIIIPVAKVEEIKDSFKDIEKYNLEYLYIDSFNFLLESFLLREKLGLDMPFILKIHTVFHWAERYIHVTPLIRKYDIIFSPSQYAKESFLRISDKFEVQVIPNFLDIKYIQKSIRYNSNWHNKKVITFMGRLTQEKGIGTLIKCMPRIICKVNNVHLNIIGPLSGEGITDYPKSPEVKKIEREVRKLGLIDRIHFKGVRFNLDKYKILSESDIFVNATVGKEEAFPMVNIEALACGLPVIATNWAGNKELIIDGENGYLVDVIRDKKKKQKVDTEQLIFLIVKVLKNNKLNLKLKENAIKTAQRFDCHKVIPKLVQLLKKRLKAKINNRWQLIKNKRVTDFRHLFNSDFLFFIYYNTHFKNENYASLYKIIFRPVSLENKHHANRKGRRKKKIIKDIKVIDKIRHNLSDFLLLKCE